MSASAPVPLNTLTQHLYQMGYGHPQITTPFGRKYMINADTTASGYPNKLVELYMQNHILPFYNNTHSNAYCGRLMSHYIQLTKQIIKKSTGAHEDDQIIFTGNGCSGVVNHLIHCMNLRNTTPEETVVFISKAEHHSNHLPWTHLPITLVYIPLNSQGLVDMEILKYEMSKYQRYSTIIASFIATSNVTGVHQPTHEISQLVHAFGGLMFWDFAASAPYIPINMHQNDSKGQYYDAIYISSHKFYGGAGTPGLLIAQKNLFKNEVPYCPAGGTVKFACPLYQTYSNNIETKETGGTPNILGSIKTGLVFDLKDRFQEYISQWEKRMLVYIQNKMVRIGGIRILNPLDNLHRQPIFSFMIDGLHYNMIVVLLNDLYGIQSRGGISCCSLLAQDLLKISPREQQKIHDQIVSDKGMPADYGWCRVSFHYSMPIYIVDYIIEAITTIAHYGAMFQKLYKYYPARNTWVYCPNKCPWDDFKSFTLSLSDYNKKPPVVYLTKALLDAQVKEVERTIQKFSLNRH
jgi:selenocysteine lyase/cysteine desulfurase